MPDTAFLHGISWPDAERRLHSSIAGRVQFSRHVGDEMDVARRKRKFASDLLITRRLCFRTDTGVEVVADVFGEVTIFGVREKQLLCEHAA